MTAPTETTSRYSSAPPLLTFLCRAAIRSLRAVTLVAMLAAALPVTAGADGEATEVWQGTDDDGNAIILYKDKDGYWGLEYKDGKWDYFETDLGGNPDPNDPTGGGTASVQNIKDALQLLKQKGGGKVGTEVVFEKTPLGKHMTGQGSGKAPVWNPGDQASPGDGSGEKGGAAEAIKQKLQQLGGLGNLEGGGGGFEVDAGSPGEQVKQKARKGGGTGDDDDDKDDGNTGGGGGFIGPPELVDPLPPVPKLLGARRFLGKQRTRVVLDMDDDAADVGPALKGLGGPDTKGLGGPDTKGLGGPDTSPAGPQLDLRQGASPSSGAPTPGKLPTRTK